MPDELFQRFLTTGLGAVVSQVTGGAIHEGDVSAFKSLKERTRKDLAKTALIRTAGTAASKFSFGLVTSKDLQNYQQTRSLKHVLLNKNLSLKNKSNIFIAGQLAGVEGYVESIFGGLLISKIITGNLQKLPETAIVGQLWRHLVTEQKNFQPKNANFGLLPPLAERERDKKIKKQKYAMRAIKDLTEM